jgi:hypothetical protein
MSAHNIHPILFAERVVSFMAFSLREIIGFHDANLLCSEALAGRAGSKRATDVSP